ncbi:autotransporter outer membrane beta-barrel domain-containing protein [Pseudoalteromonas denitrificans]|uniref:Outer membrane autotransporter barrel domain-containing protein n=1 Tax=Pseudoalteromonas denitrificans DSM 6059 TaxID=1123010 RepID=A0A1I1LQN8_9GAMM|nr:autotransporter outer membrane beta-barrel domain-containing protein [Pseudoalteromonas denitrificans]SFC75329.1 outer membrane autotransporter barrel domain-containing protein [Pseudoalteromonas denitrificans DSM 6059]
MIVKKQDVMAFMFIGFSSMYFIPVQAASPEFQDFLFVACNTAQTGSDLDKRCNVDSQNGDLSGDSEDSLNPTQSLSNMANALAQTRSRIKALQEKMKQQRDKNKTSMKQAQHSQSTMDRFQLAGISLLFGGGNSDLEHELTELERGYNTDSIKFQAGVDYRLADDWIVGSMLSFENDDTKFDADLAGRNFDPGNTEGESSADTISLNLFTTKNINESFYFDALISYSWSDYNFSRVALFQESTRTIPTLDVVTDADSSGKQLALGLGIGWDYSISGHNYQAYSRINYQKSKIDAYSETGGSGFAMQVAGKKENETLLTLGLKYSYAINTSSAVIVPQIFAEYENLLESKKQSTQSRFISDTSGAEFTVLGDEIDKQYGRAGIGLVAVLPNGWTIFASIDEEFNKNLIEQMQFNAGLRLEF